MIIINSYNKIFLGMIMIIINSYIIRSFLGTYVCEVTNGIGRAQHAPAILEVTCKCWGPCVLFYHSFTYISTDFEDLVFCSTIHLLTFLQIRLEWCSPQQSSTCPWPWAGSSTATSSRTLPSSSSRGPRTRGYSTPSTWTRSPPSPTGPCSSTG